MPTLQQLFNSFNNFLGEFRQHRHTGVDGLKVNYTDINGVPYTFFAGHVNDSGAATLLPKGWISSLASGTYTIKHNLGISDYMVLVTPRADANSYNPASDIVFPVIGETLANVFDLAFFTNNNTSTKITTHFNFILTYPN